LARDDFVLRSPVNADDKFKDFALRTTTDSDPAGPPYALTGVIVKTITEQPKDWPAAPGSVMPVNQDTPTGQAYKDLYPVVHLNNKQYQGQINPAAGSPKVSTMRLADLLLPMGLGPTNDPSLMNPAEPGADWLTLSEALGLA